MFISHLINSNIKQSINYSENSKIEWNSVKLYRFTQKKQVN